MPEERGTLTIVANRGGSIAEITSFLSDLEDAYVALYSFHRLWLPERLSDRFPVRVWLGLRFPSAVFGQTRSTPLTADSVPPDSRIALERVNIGSPGIWEFLASLNPLQQIREYLNDRHRRRQDREYREPSERTRLELEDEVIRLQIEKSELLNLKEFVTILRDLGYDDSDIQRIFWMNVGSPLSRLGRHQDSNLIGGAE